VVGDDDGGAAEFLLPEVGECVEEFGFGHGAGALGFRKM
jgi:hypothetical protein